MRRFKLGVATVLALSSLLLATACSDGATTIERGVVTLALTDAPFPFDSVERADVFVVRIDAKTANVDSADADDDLDDGDAGEDGWVTLAEPQQAFNLVALQGGTTLTLGSTSIPVGTYRTFRIVIDHDQTSLTLTDGTVLTGSSNPGIKFPSGDRSGIKIKLAEPLQVTSAGANVVVDFDLAQSFVMRGNSLRGQGLLFKPVVRATLVGETGAISGTVTASGVSVGTGGIGTEVVLENATVEILVNGTPLDDADPDNVVAITTTDAEGNFTAAFLPPGTYSVRVYPPSGVSADAEVVAGIIVVSGETTAGIDFFLE